MKPQFDPFLRRKESKCTTIYATTYHTKFTDKHLSVADCDHFNLGRLRKFYVANSSQFPRIISSQILIEPDFIGKRSKDLIKLGNAEIFLYVVPSKQVLLSISVSFDANLIQSIELMEDFYYMQVQISGNDVLGIIQKLGENEGVEFSGTGFDETYHQIFTAGKRFIGESIDKDFVQKIVYRADLPCREDFNSILYPDELNRRPYTFCGHTSFVTCLGGHQGYIEDCLQVSALTVVSSVSMLRRVKRVSHYLLERAEEQTAYVKPSIKEARNIISDALSTLSELHLYLGLYVEAPAQLGMLVPALRLESYHNSLVFSNELYQRTQTIRGILEQIESIFSYEKNRIIRLERESDEAHRVMWTVVVSLLSAISIPPAIVFSFFGANIREVPPDSSITDLERFGALYLFVLLSVIVALIVGFVMWMILRPRHKRFSKKVFEKSIWQ